MRFFKWKVDIYQGPENMFNYVKKDILIVNDDSLIEEDIRKKIKVKFLNDYEKENMISKIKLKEINQI